MILRVHIVLLVFVTVVVVGGGGRSVAVVVVVIFAASSHPAHRAFIFGDDTAVANLLVLELPNLLGPSGAGREYGVVTRADQQQRARAHVFLFVLVFVSDLHKELGAFAIHRLNFDTEL